MARWILVLAPVIWRAFGSKSRRTTACFRCGHGLARCLHGGRGNVCDYVLADTCSDASSTVSTAETIVNIILMEIGRAFWSLCCCGLFFLFCRIGAWIQLVPKMQVLFRRRYRPNQNSGHECWRRRAFPGVVIRVRVSCRFSMARIRSM